MLPRLIEHADGKYVSEILSMLDELILAIRNIPPGAREEAGELVNAVTGAAGSLETNLRSLGVEKIHMVGTPFDPNKHEAVGVVEVGCTDNAEDTVVEEVSPGYAIRGKVIRPAKVRVAM